MKNAKDILIRLRKGDYAVVLVTVLISLLLFLFSFSSGEKLTAHIYYNGESYGTVNLYELGQSRRLTVGNCVLLLEGDGVTFLSSECEDRLCINRGKLKRAGDTMACVPEMVSVVLRADKNDADAVAF